MMHLETISCYEVYNLPRQTIKVDLFGEKLNANYVNLYSKNNNWGLKGKAKLTANLL